MAQERTPPNIKNYYETLKKIFQFQSSTLSAVLPHAGERGRNDEEIIRKFLSNILPRRFSLGTGFIISSEPNIPPSSQTDIIIYDELLNSPLYRELTATVYPIEIVYAAIEIKGSLTSKNLSKSLDDIKKIRRLGKHKAIIYLTGPRQ